MLPPRCFARETKCKKRQCNDNTEYRPRHDPIVPGRRIKPLQQIEKHSLLGCWGFAQGLSTSVELVKGGQCMIRQDFISDPSQFADRMLRSALRRCIVSKDGILKGKMRR